ncbi:MAG: hypothetical protein JNK85_04930 [Verrucomicrobiales bacterium]|nr:hypothetical protein [Verrucomicrobiales bacterium]
MRTRITRIGVSILGIALTVCMANLKADAAGANIVWVSFHSADNTPSAAAVGAGFTQAPDAAYTQLLRSAGHTVTRYVTTATPDVALLNTFDLVVISRSVPSGNYQTPESTALWNGLTKPTLVMGGYILRGSRLGYTLGDTIPDTAGPIRLTASDPSHPIFTGVSLDAANTMVNVYADLVTYNGTVQRGISVNSSDIAGGGTVLATVGTDTDPAFGGMIIGEYPAGTTMGNASGDVAGGKRLVFLTGSREQTITSEGAGIFDLSQDGARLFLNAVGYMTGIAVTEPPPLVTQVEPSSGTTQYYAPRGLRFRATSGLSGGIPPENISLTLNGTNATAGLTIGGTPQDRHVTFSGLVPGAQYTALITVKDAIARETVVSLTFDTLAPYTLPAANAFPVSAAVASASGFRARIAQSYDAPVLANTSDRAEAQLAGTLIDPATSEPYPNLATPSADNADGSYNRDLVNWSVQAEQGAERGSFQAPSFPDAPVPGLTHNFNYVIEVITYLELAPGRYRMGVNSDDGFVVTAGVHPRDLLATGLGRFDGSRGASDSLFQFEVTEAGLYPFRLLYYQGDGDGNVEWFLSNPLTDEKTLINDRSRPNAVRAWRQISVPDRPFIAALNPVPGERNVDVAATLSAVIQDAGATVQAGSVQLSLNGQSVTPQVTQTGGRTTVTYKGPQNLASDSLQSVTLAYTDSASRSRTASYDFTTRFVPPVQSGAKIAWVSFHASDLEPSAAALAAGFTNAPDVEYTRLLTTAGHTVTRYLTTAAPDPAVLETFDLVVVSRSNPSGNFQSADSTALWHGLKVPTLHLGGYALRGSRLGHVTGDTIPDTTGPIRLRVNQASHPIFSGIALDATGVMANTYARVVTYNGTVQRGISVNTSPVTPGATVLATVGTATDPASGGTVIAEFPKGTVMGNPSADVAASKELVFLTGSREQGITAEGAGIFDLDGDGARMFLNAVRYLAGLPDTTPAKVSLTVTRGSGNNLVVAWPENGTQTLVLRTTSTLIPASWQAVATQPTVANGQRSVSVPITGTTQFFGLFQP